MHKHVTNSTIEELNVPQITSPLKTHSRRHWPIYGAIMLFSIVVLATLAVLQHVAHKDSVSRAAVVVHQANIVPQLVQQSTSSASSLTTWVAKVDAAALPLGDGRVGSVPAVGYVDSCTQSFRGGGARHAGSWINAASGTWNANTKIAVTGSITWPNANYVETIEATTRLIRTNDLPESFSTGIFPIQSTDPAYQYDTNPNSIGLQTLSYSLPVTPAAAAVPGCLPLGPVGVTSDGVVLFNALDDSGRDAVAHETQDSCDGHPNKQEMYHYHNIASCIRNRATGSSTLVGYAFDGYGIYVERDQAGNLPTNADLDSCHGSTSPVLWDGSIVSMYHYDATLEYPYTLGCYHGSAISMNRG